MHQVLSFLNVITIIIPIVYVLLVGIFFWQFSALTPYQQDHAKIKIGMIHIIIFIACISWQFAK